MMRGWLAPLFRRWDFETDPESPAPFSYVVTLINLRRVEVFSIALLVDGAVEIFLNLTDRMMLDGWLSIACIPALVGFIVAGNRLQASKNERLQKVLPLVLIVFTLLTTQLTIAVIASDGRVTSAYPVIILAIAIFFVLPPRMLAWIFSVSLAVYVLIVLRMPVSAWEKLVASLNGAMATGGAIAAGWLIYDARARNHVQKLLIHRQNLQLVARAHEMDEMMAITAHDLRSPLLGLRNLFQFATARADVEPQLPLQVIGDAMGSLEAMLDLVRRLLAAHRAEHDRGQPPIRDDLRRHLTAAVDRALPLARAGQVAIAADLPPRPLWASFDPEALAPMLDNLLANAVRFSPQGETILVRCWSEGALAVIIVEDRGPGVAEEDRPFLFEKFRRGRPASRDGSEGTGIGLFIVATLAARIGAQVHHRPASPRGSTFEILLPMME